MRFKFGGNTYSLSIARKHQHVPFFTDGVRHVIKSTFPYTTVGLFLEKDNEIALLASGTVGCLPKDQYSPRTGVRLALQALTKRLSRLQKTNPNGPYTREFRAAMWEAYWDFRRTAGQVVEAESVTQVAEGTASVQEVELPPTVH
jgi:hypothetical protein